MNENCQCSRLLKSVTRFCRCADTLSSLSVGRQMQTLLHSSCWMRDWCGAVCRIYCKNVCFIQAVFCCYIGLQSYRGEDGVSRGIKLVSGPYFMTPSICVIASRGKVRAATTSVREKRKKSLYWEITQLPQLACVVISSIDYCTSGASLEGALETPDASRVVHERSWYQQYSRGLDPGGGRPSSLLMSQYSSVRQIDLPKQIIIATLSAR
jgi:hypothetical protein